MKFLMNNVNNKYELEQLLEFVGIK